METLTATAITRAYLLALHHGHEWASLLSSRHFHQWWSDNPAASHYDGPEQTVELALEGLLGAKSWEEFLELLDPIMEGSPSSEIAGIVRPHIEGDVHHHTTGTGRLDWWVRADGSVAIKVSRPGGVVFVGMLSPERGEECVVWIETDRSEGEPRHWFALSEAINAIVGGESS